MTGEMEIFQHLQLCLLILALFADFSDMRGCQASSDEIDSDSDESKESTDEDDSIENEDENEEITDEDESEENVSHGGEEYDDTDELAATLEL